MHPALVLDSSMNAQQHLMSMPNRKRLHTAVVVGATLASLENANKNREPENALRLILSSLHHTDDKSKIRQTLILTVMDSTMNPRSVLKINDNPTQQGTVEHSLDALLTNELHVAAQLNTVPEQLHIVWTKSLVMTQAVTAAAVIAGYLCTKQEWDQPGIGTDADQESVVLSWSPDARCYLDIALANTGWAPYNVQYRITGGNTETDDWIDREIDDTQQLLALLNEALMIF